MSRPKWLHRLDRISIAAYCLVWGAAILHVAPAFGEAGYRSILPTVLGGLAGFLLADLISGLVHWLADRFFDPKTPILGPALIAPFREHHDDALAMTRHDFFEVTGNNALVTLPLGFGLIGSFPSPALTGTPATTLSMWLAATTISFAFFILATNQFHCWAHTRNPPPMARRLQRSGLILSPAKHARHHRKAHDSDYCVTSGWMNPLLDGIGFFTVLERAIEGVQDFLGLSKPTSGRSRPQ